jgi:hypothetical protein
MALEQAPLNQQLVIRRHMAISEDRLWNGQDDVPVALYSSAVAIFG